MLLSFRTVVYGLRCTAHAHRESTTFAVAMPRTANDLDRLGLLSETTGQMRDRLYTFEAYLKLFLS
jgi:hypothetical protein